jgi:hypothetical protein
MRGAFTQNCSANIDRAEHCVASRVPRSLWTAPEITYRFDQKTCVVLQSPPNISLDTIVTGFSHSPKLGARTGVVHNHDATALFGMRCIAVGEDFVAQEAIVAGSTLHLYADTIVALDCIVAKDVIP